MKRFFQFFTASCLGTVAALGLIILVFFLIGLSSAASGKPSVKKQSFLVLDLNQFIPERTNNVAEQPYNFESFEALGMRHITRVLAKAKDDTNIKGIILNPKFMMHEQSKVYNLKNALSDFRSSGKPIYAYADYYTQSAYQISSVADSVFLNPNGGVDFRGFAALYPFYTGLMEKLDIKMNIFYAGDFKSATEPYRRKDMSPENKLQTREFLSELDDAMIQDIAESRSLNTDDLERVKNEYEAFTADGALSNGLIDSLLYWDQFEDHLRKYLGYEEGKKLNTIPLKTYAQTVDILDKSKSKDKIAIVYAEGTIKYGDTEKGAITNDQYMPLIEKLRKKKDVKAIVLRINSPGGSGFSSDIIWRELEKTRNEGKPIIASMGTYAASGGYYLAAPADTIVAEPTTLTGSIGVFSMFPNFKSFLNEKIGVHFDTVSTGQNALSLSPLYDLSPEQNAMMQSTTDKLYDQFLGRVAEGRGMTKDEVHSIGQGRIWSGIKAKELGLVDEIGGLEEAVAIAAEAADLSEYKVIEYPHIKVDPWMQIINSFASELSLKKKTLVPEEIKSMLPIYDEVKIWLENDKPQARLPIMIR